MRKTVFLLLIGVFFLFGGCAENKEDNMNQELLNYCKNNDTVTLSDITKFNWDVAYLDYQVYGQGENLKNTYGITGKFEGLNSEEQFAIAFCKNGKLVKYSICNWLDIMFGETLPSDDKQIVVIYPNDIFTVKWKQDEMRNKSTLYLL